MKRSVLLFVLLAVLFSATPLFAQEASPQMHFIMTHTIQPGKVPLHNECFEGITQCHKKYGLKYPYYSFNSESKKYFAVMPMRSFADIDKIIADIGRVAVEAGQEWERYREMEIASAASYSMSAYIYRPDLSYQPRNNRLTHSEAGFRRWTFYTVKYGSEPVFEEKMKALAVMYEKKGIPDAFSVHAAMMENDMPLYVVEQYGRDKDDFYVHHKQNMDTLGSGSKALFETLMPHIRKVETELVVYMPELSMPER